MKTYKLTKTEFKNGKFLYEVKDEDNTYDGREGEIEQIDGIGQLHGTWGGLAVIPEADKCIVIG